MCLDTGRHLTRKLLGARLARPPQMGLPWVPELVVAARTGSPAAGRSSVRHGHLNAGGANPIAVGRCSGGMMPLGSYPDRVLTLIRAAPGILRTFYFGLVDQAVREQGDAEAES